MVSSSAFGGLLMFGIWCAESEVATVFLARRPQERRIDAVRT